MLSENERNILRELTANPFISQQELAKTIGLSRPAVGNIISGLTEKGYIVGRQYLLNYERFIICIGGANLDRTFRLQKEMILESSNPVTGSESFGGVARNVAENLGRLGCPVSLMTIVGDDRDGERLLFHASSVMNIFMTEKTRMQNTGSYIAVLDPAGDLSVGFANMDITDGMDAEWIQRHSNHLNLSDWILCDCNVRKDAMEALVQCARDRKSNLAIVGVSSAKMDRVPKDLEGVRVLICNREESMAYFDTEETSAEALCRMWMETGVAAAVVTAGTEPFAAGDASGVRTCSVQAVAQEELKSVTGAGDAFSAGILYGLIHGHSLEASLEYAKTLSRLTLQDAGSVREDITRHRLLEETKLESLS